MSSMLAADAELMRLGNLAAHHHRLAAAAARKTLEHALACGDALLAARGRIPEGEWNHWLAENTAMDRTTAQMYCRLATFRAQLSEAGVEGVQAARDYVRQHGLRVEVRQHSQDLVLEIRRLGDAGSSQREIARHVGASRSNVGAILRGERHGPRREAPIRDAEDREIDDDLIERVAAWLARRFARNLDDGLRDEALQLLGVILGAERRRAA